MYSKWKLLGKIVLCDLTLYDEYKDNFNISRSVIFFNNDYCIRYARACSSYECFILRAERLSSKRLGQGYVMERLQSSLRKFYGRYWDLIKHYAVSLSQMLHDILGHDHTQ